MTALREKEIAHRLASVDVPPPPPDLLDRLRKDIPTLVPALDLGPQVPKRRHFYRGPWLAAASIAVALLGGFLALRVTESGQRSSAREVEGPAAETPDGVVQEVAGVGEEKASRKAPITEVLVLQTAPQDAPISRAQPPEGQEQVEPGRLEGDAVAHRGGAPRVEPEEPASADLRQREVETQRLLESREQRNRAPTVPPPLRRKNPQPDAESDQVVALESFDDLIEVQGEAPANIAIESVGSVEKRQGKKSRRQLPKPIAAVAPTVSTGGTAEPNDQPYGDVFFRHSGTNPFVDTEDDPLSTFGLDVDTGSYGVLRRYLSDGHLPPPEAVRVEEVVNAFDYGDSPPREGDFALYGEGARTPFAEGSNYRLLRFAVQGRVVDTADRKAALLVFVVDVSGSMNRGDRLGLVKKSLGLLLDELREGDRVGLVIFGSRGEVLLEPTGDLERIRSAIDRVTPSGSTNAEEGLLLGYQLASRHFRQGGINRVILCSDGVANVGRTGAESLLQRIREEAEQGIELTTLGFGMGNYNDVLMERLADEGDGRYAYLDTLAEARRVLVEDLTGTLQTIASEARAQVEFNPQAVERYRLLGYENRDIADHRFRDDTVDAGEIGAGHGVTVLYEVKLADRVPRKAEIATLRLRYRSAVSGKFEEVSRTVTARQVQGSWNDATPAFRLASLVAEMAEILKQTYWARRSSMDDVFRRAQVLSPSFEGSERVAELVSLAGKAARLMKTDQEVEE